jgi:NAD(P)-dependent dehydrogenase (short-subunit alcohol dehydrogenase family)
MATSGRPRDGDTVAVTGCSSGIGLALAEGLQRRGYRVIASARREADLEHLRGLGVEALPLELADPDSVAAFADAVRERAEGRLRGLVNNAAYGQPGAVEDLPRDVLRHQLEVNLLGTHDLTARLMPAFRAQGFGRIVQMSSVLGLVALPYRGAYNTSKFALEGLTDTLRLELADTAIHPVLIEPGPITSRFPDNALRAFRANIDPSASPHRAVYEARVVARLQGEDPTPGTLGPEAVLARTVTALEARRPRPRYFVTWPTHVLAAVRRVLTGRGLDRVLGRIG